MTKFTYILERMVRIIRLEVLNQLIEFTYALETDEDDGMR